MFASQNISRWLDNFCYFLLVNLNISIRYLQPYYLFKWHFNVVSDFMNVRTSVCQLSSLPDTSIAPSVHFHRNLINILYLGVTRRQGHTCINARRGQTQSVVIRSTQAR